MGEHLQVQQVKPRSGRLVVFDLLKLLAIFLVLWGHCVQHLLSPAYGEEPLHRVIYSFHMPLFMMISGFFAGSSARLTWGVFLKKKFVQLLLPWLTWSALLIVAKALATSTLWGLGLSDHGIDEERLLSYIDVFEGSFWFLKTAFVCHVLSFIAMQAGRYKALAIAISLLASHYLNFVQLPSIMYASFLVGMLLKARWEQFVRHARVIFPIALVGYLLLFLWSEQYMPLTMHLFSNPWAWALKIPLGLLGSIAVVALFAIIFSDDQTEVLSPPPPICNSHINTLGEWGQYTLGIYILQVFILETLMPRLINLDAMPRFVSYFVVMPLISVATLVVCVYIVKAIMRYRIPALMFLGKQ